MKFLADAHISVEMVAMIRDLGHDCSDGSAIPPRMTNCESKTVLGDSAVREVRQIVLKLDRKSFDVVLGTFSFMHDHYHNRAVIDPAALMISQQDIAGMIKKLTSSDTRGDQVAIPMNFKDWTVYCGLLAHTSDKIPQADPDAYDILETLFDECDRLDDAGEAPRGPEGVEGKTGHVH